MLRQQGVFLKVSEESGEQVLWVRSENEARVVREVLSSIERGELSVVAPEQARAEQRATRNSLGNSLISAIWWLVTFSHAAPLSSAIAFLCLVVAVITKLGTDVTPVLWLFFPEVDSSGVFSLIVSLDSPLLLLRSLTPALLHFGEIHLVFNLLWLFYFGRMLENEQPTGLVFTVYVVATFGGNVLQYLSTGSNAFGGLSGLIYGLVGYTWVIGLFFREGRVQLRLSTFVVFIVALLLMAVLASNSIASGAHIGGLVAGLLCGVIAGYWMRQRESRNQR